MESDRRTFLWQSAGLAAATLIGAQTAAEDRQAASPAELLKRMSWMNESASSNLVGDKLAVRSRAKTDFWRKTFYGYITDNAWEQRRAQSLRPVACTLRRSSLMRQRCP